MKTNREAEQENEMMTTTTGASAEAHVPAPAVPAPRPPQDNSDDGQSRRRRTTTRRRPPVETLKVRDQDRVLEFVGEKIGHASSEGPHSLRWTEIEIYKTEAGNYVVHRIGVSLVYHSLNGRGKNCRSGRTVEAADVARDIDAEPCPDCQPDLDAVSRVRQETDRHSAEAVSGAQDLVRALSLTRDNGMTYLSAVAREALLKAAEKDPDLSALTTATVYVA